MQNLIDTATQDAEAKLKEILLGLPLTPEEKEYAKVAARRLAQNAYDSFSSLTEEKRAAMRPIVLAVALAMLIGPHTAWERGADVYNKPE